MILIVALALLLALAVAGLAGSLRLVYLGCLVATLALMAAGAGYFLAPSLEETALVLPLGLPWVKMHFRLDSLSAFFLIVVNLASAGASLFGIGYGGHVPEPRRVTPVFPLFLAGMNLVVLADDAFTFLVAWEFMSLSSWLLVLSDHRRPENRSAAALYLIMAAFGTFCLLPTFGLMAAGGDYSFAAMRAVPMTGLKGALVVLLALLGCGSKAGLVPLHAWLPQAHPAAPAHVSALMSGVMTKVALYGLIRILFDLHGQVDWRWGAVMMGVGALTAVLGILHALMETDLKRMLAYSTVENVGIAVVGLGLALAFQAKALPDLAAVALVAALYHMLNHSLFKGLLFLGSGAILYATGERRMDQLGGLLKRMPMAGLAFLIGAAAISALPPLNGFVSEWLVFQSLLKGPALPLWSMKFGVPVVGALLALAAALAAACFVRAYGICFLGRARSEAAREAREISRPMWMALTTMAVLCVGLGIFPVTVTGALSIVVQPLVGVHLPPSADLGWPWLSPTGGSRGAYSATMLILTGIAMILTTILVVHHFGTRKLRRAPAWDCGHREAIVNAQYTADSFAQPLRRVFGSTLFAAKENVEMPVPGDTAPARFSVGWHDPVWEYLYLPLMALVRYLAEKANRLQYLTVRRYLLMMFATLVILLLVVAMRQ